MSKVKLCKTCKHWRVLDNTAGRWGECGVEGKLIVGGDYAESAMTTPVDFGCILWEEKEDGENN